MRSAGLAALLIAGMSGVANAQSFWGGEYERAMRPGVYTPYDGHGPSHRYNLGFGSPIFYPGMDAQRLWQLEYLDRWVRAEKFGYALHPNPYTEPTPAPPLPYRRGWFRR